MPIIFTEQGDRKYVPGAIIDPNDIRVDVISVRRYGMDVATVKGSFVKVEHIPTGIIVTKYSDKSQLHARQEAFDELEQYIKLWNREG